MFELPDAKRVRRENLYDSESEPEPEIHNDAEAAAEAQAKLQRHLASLLSFDVTPPPPAEVSPGPHPDGEDAEQLPSEKGAGEVFEFRLFASRDSANGSVAKVMLAPETIAADGDAGTAGEGGIVRRRPLSYYFAKPPTAEDEERWRLSAVTGEEVLERSKQRAWGLEKPWRVIRIVVPSSSRSNSSGSKIGKPTSSTVLESTSQGQSRGGEGRGELDSNKRKRPGKRQRIALRTKAKAEEAAREKEEELARTRLSKEEHLLEKKKRLNREKKLKRRQKEREKKLASRAADGAVATGTVATAAAAATIGNDWHEDPGSDSD